MVDVKTDGTKTNVGANVVPGNTAASKAAPMTAGKKHVVETDEQKRIRKAGIKRRRAQHETEAKK